MEDRSEVRGAEYVQQQGSHPEKLLIDLVLRDGHMFPQGKRKESSSKQKEVVCRGNKECRIHEVAEQ